MGTLLQGAELATGQPVVTGGQVNVPVVLYLQLRDANGVDLEEKGAAVTTANVLNLDTTAAGRAFLSSTCRPNLSRFSETGGNHLTYPTIGAHV